MNALSTPIAPAQVAIRNANACFAQAFQAHDAREIAEQYAAGGQLLPAQSSILTGCQAIQAFWQGVLDMGIYCAERRSNEIQSAAILANEIGTYVLRRPDKQVADQGIYVALWQWDAGRWQIHHEVWHSRRVARLTKGSHHVISRESDHD